MGMFSPRAMIDGDMARRPAQSRDFAQHLLGALEDALPVARATCPPAATPRAGDRATHRGRPAGAPTGRARLGTLVELEETQFSGRPVILQAIRILEELEMVEMVPGRGAALRCTPSPGAVVRALYPHFVLQRLTMDASRDIIWSINLATASYAARHRSPEQAQGWPRPGKG
jgi:hypothetical protein